MPAPAVNGPATADARRDWRAYRPGPGAHLPRHGGALRTVSGQLVVAIPARNEAECLPLCLEALAGQRDAPPFGVVVFANNCDDSTVPDARAMAGRLPYPLLVVDISLPEPQRTAGHARRGAMDLAAEHAGDGILLSTDADARPRPDWLANVTRHVGAGADAVAGRAIMIGAEAETLSGPLRDRLRREAWLARLMDRIAAAIDEVSWDPWPRHCGHWGANFAVRAQTYRACGGVSQVLLAEDRAFFALLQSDEARIRHAEDCIVEVSARVQGRAPGGMADVLARRMAGDDPLCDAALEPLGHALRRYRLRRALRAGGDFANPRNALRLGLDEAALHDAVTGATAGEGWARLLREAPALREVRLPHDRLERQIAAALAVLRRLCPGEPPPEPAAEETLV